MKNLITMKQKIKDEMLEVIFVQTGGRPENPKIAEICAEIAVNFITSNTVLSGDSEQFYCCIGQRCNEQFLTCFQFENKD